MGPGPRAGTAVQTVRLFDLSFDALTLSQGADAIVSAARARRRGLVVTPNVDHILMLDEDPELRTIYDEALFRFADGMPLVWLSKLLSGTSLPERVTGADLLVAVCERAAKHGLSVYFLGAEEGVAARAAALMSAQHPGLRIAGTYSPPMGFDRDVASLADAIARVAASSPDILFLGLGTPKQERLAHRNLSALRSGPILCCGAAFDFAAGAKARAPRLMQRAGLEWLFRLGQEPRRLWRRYLVRYPRFLRAALLELRRRGARA